MSPESGRNEDIGGNVVVASMNLGVSPPAGRHENSRTPMGGSQDTTAGREPSSPPAKRTKRGKYISRAWYVYCHGSGSDVSRLISPSRSSVQHANNARSRSVDNPETQPLLHMAKQTQVRGWRSLCSLQSQGSSLRVCFQRSAQTSPQALRPWLCRGSTQH